MMNEHVRQVSGDQSQTVQKDALTKWRQDDDETNWVQEECCSIQKWKNYSDIHFVRREVHKCNKMKLPRKDYYKN